jgi:RNA polymerase sigma factor (sigma-70 family)
MKKNMEQLYLENEKMIYKIAHKYSKIGSYYGFDLDDLVSIQHIGFMKAIKSYDETKNIKFITYLTKVLEREVQREIALIKDCQKRQSNINTFSLNYEVEGKNGNKDEFSMAEPIVENPFEEIEYKELLEGILELVKNRSGARTIITMKIDGYSMKEVGQALGISEKAAFKRYTDIKKCIKNRMKIEHFGI